MPKQPQKQPRVRGVRSALLEEFHRKPGQVLYLQDLMTALDFEERQVRNSLNAILRMGNSGIVVDIPGRSWVYRPAKQSSKRMFQEIGKTKNGAIVIEDENGNLYAAKELDL